MTSYRKKTLLNASGLVVGSIGGIINRAFFWGMTEPEQMFSRFVEICCLLLCIVSLFSQLALKSDPRTDYEK